MDLIDKLKELSVRVEQQKSSVLTEEASKTAFVLPFIQALGYDVFSPFEVIPEFTADHGVKNGEKVDYAIKQDEKITVIIECKAVGAKLDANHASQLFRYFSVTEARFGVLTDGIRYLFFSDLDKPNQMDTRPFFEFNLLQFSDGQVDELKKFTKSSFDLDTIVSTAENLKYHRALLAEINAEFENPSEDLVKLLVGRFYTGRFTQNVKEKFTALTQKALREFIRGRVNERLKNAIDTEAADIVDAQPVEVAEDAQQDLDEQIETTAEELAAYRIVQAIGSEIANPDSITIRDNKSYCAVLWDDNNRNPICRFHFLKTKLSVSVFSPEGEVRHEIEKPVDIYQLRSQIQAAVQQYSA